MKVKLTFPVDSLSGKTAGALGHVGFNWRGIQVFRKMVTPRNPRTADQVAIRTILTQGAQGFQSITDANKTAWRAYASSRTIDVMGKQIQLPEISMFVRNNSWRQIDGGAISDTPPAYFADFSASAIGTLAYVGSTNTMTFVVTHNCSVTTNKKWLIRLTGKLPSGQKVPTQSDFRLAMGVTTDSIIPVTASPQTVTLVAPVFSDYTDDCYLGVELLPFSADYDEGTPLRVVDQISVT